MVCRLERVVFVLTILIVMSSCSPRITKSGAYGTSVNAISSNVYPSLMELKADKNAIGVACTLGYYKPNDGGGGQYYITDKGTEDGGNCVKLDNVEALILTGEENLEKAARKIAGWGCGELIISSAKRAVCLADGQMYSGSFCNRNSSGRTGRGDTLFGSYLSARLNREPEEAFRFALTLVSIKMETPGPFCGTLEQVLSRMGEVVVRRV